MTDTLRDRMAALPAGDRRLIAGMGAASLATLMLGILGGLLAGLARGGFIDAAPDAGYRFLTVHGVGIFFYWLYLAQVALLSGFAAVEDGRGLAWRGAAKAGFMLIGAGFLFSMGGAHVGQPLLYDGSPALAMDEPGTLLFFNLGYLLLSLGLMASSAALFSPGPDS